MVNAGKICLEAAFICGMSPLNCTRRLIFSLCFNVFHLLLAIQCSSTYNYRTVSHVGGLVHVDSSVSGVK